MKRNNNAISSIQEEIACNTTRLDFSILLRGAKSKKKKNAFYP